MATKKSGASRPKIGSSHSKRPATGRGGGAPAKGGRPAEKRPAKRTAKTPTRTGAAAAKTTTRPKRPAAPRPSKAAARAIAVETATQKPRKAAPPEIRTEAAEASKDLALSVAKAALDKKALNVQIVDVVGRVDYTDFLVVMSGRSDRHVLAVADSIEEELRKVKRKPTSVEGRPLGAWVILDFGDVVAHVFQEEARSFYDLDTLWQDARRVPVSSLERGPTSAGEPPRPLA